MGWDGSAAAAAVDDVAVFDIMSNVKSPGGVQRGTGNGLAKVKTANHLCESQQALLLCVGYYDYADDNSFKCVLISLPFSLKSHLLRVDLHHCLLHSSGRCCCCCSRPFARRRRVEWRTIFSRTALAE